MKFLGPNKDKSGDCRWGERYFSPPKRPNRLWDLPRLYRRFFCRVKVLAFEADHLHLMRRIRIRGALPSLSLHVLHSYLRWTVIYCLPIPDDGMQWRTGKGNLFRFTPMVETIRLQHSNSAHVTTHYSRREVKERCPVCKAGVRNIELWWWPSQGIGR
jgi:hypothetical protein